MPPSNPILALALWGLANSFALGLAAILWRPLRVDSRRLDGLLFGFLWIYLTTLLVMLFGLAGWLDPVSISVVSGLGCVALLITPRFRRRVVSSLHKMRLLVLELAATRSFETGGLLLLITLQLTRMAVHVWLLPPYVWDALTYHLPRVAEWVQAGRLVTFETPVVRSYWPANYELFETWFVLFPHHDFLIDAASVPFYLLAAGSVYSIARSLGVGRRYATLTAVIFGYTPSVALHATSANNDLPIAAIYLFALAQILDWRERPRALGQRLVALGMLFGFAVGTKPYIVFLLPGLLLPVVWAYRNRASEPDSAASQPGVSRAALAFAALSGLTLSGYWFIRNLVLFGNPFYPTRASVLGLAVGGEGVADAQQGAFRLASLVESFWLLLTERIFDRGAPFSAELDHISGWGWFLFACGLPALMVGLWRRASLRWLTAGFLVSLGGLFAMVTPDPWMMRFTLWFPALFAVAFGAVVSRLHPTLLRRTLWLVAVVCLALNFIGTLDIGRLTPGDWRRMAKLSVWKRSSATLGLYTGPSYQAALDRVPAGERLGYHVSGDGWIYPLYGADLSRSLEYLWVGSDTDLDLELHRRELRYLFVSLPSDLVERSLAESHLHRLGEGLYERRN